jgi:hypothetical protein
MPEFDYSALQNEVKALQNELTAVKELSYQLLDLAYSLDRRLTIVENKENEK